jgi:hypothetical protein
MARISSSRSRRVDRANLTAATARTRWCTPVESPATAPTSTNFPGRGIGEAQVGLGLAISRWGAEANSGRIYARNLPDHGCIFTIDLPRVALSLSATTVNQGVAQTG